MHFSDPGLRYLFAMGFLLMGAFVTTYNYIGFRLEAPPFSLSQTAIGFVYCIYLVGAVASAAMGRTRRPLWPAPRHWLRHRFHADRRPPHLA